ncbi:hypothetical protein [Lacticaseibacillus absianus]|uniref:hypothetical protein n=1 Tax=Lacticaseibacillus absianus TaxID=2729623 RepID=UPI0015CE5383|nr:hypothetical protein [Lacticaseibacillus absianus]
MFDERQLTARRRGYTGGFWGLLGLLGVNQTRIMLADHSLFADQFTLTMWCLLLVMTPVTCYFILTGAYLRPHQGDGSLLAFALLGLAWLLMAGQELWWQVTLHYGQPLIHNGQLTADSVSAALPLMWGVIGGVAGFQWWRNRHPKAD